MIDGQGKIFRSCSLENSPLNKYIQIKQSKSLLMKYKLTLINQFYLTIQGMLIVDEKSVVFSSFFRIISKTAQTILIKKIRRNHSISFFKKALISEHRKNYIFRDNNCFVKMSVS